VPQLKAILFDIDDTLFSTTEFARKARQNAVRAMVRAGLDLPEETVARELEEVLAEFSSNYEHHFDKLLNRLRPPSLARVNPALIVAAGVVAYHDTKFRELVPFEDVLPFFRALRKVGMRLGIITHGWTVKQAEKLVRLGVVPCLEPSAIFISDQIGIGKPNPKLWTLALADMHLLPQETMYVGDSPENDVSAPRALGMVTVWAARASKHKLESGRNEPDHTVSDFRELAAILRERYGVKLEAF
jgi:putative hydrolase of the HAD superfamily